MWIQKCKDQNQMYKTCELSPRTCSRGGHTPVSVCHKIHYRRHHLQKRDSQMRSGELPSWQATGQALKTWAGLTVVVKSNGKCQSLDSFRERTWRVLDILDLSWILVDKAISGTLKMWKGIDYPTLCIWYAQCTRYMFSSSWVLRVGTEGKWKFLFFTRYILLESEFRVHWLLHVSWRVQHGEVLSPVPEEKKRQAQYKLGSDWLERSFA